MKYCLLIVASLLVISSCTKVEPTESKQEKLRKEKWVLDTGFVRKIWKMDGMEVPADMDVTESYPEPECRADDILDFKDGNEGVHLPGDVTCSINETSEIEFRWGLLDNDKKMFIYDAKEFFGTDVNAEVVEFYDDKFGIRFSTYKDKHITFVGKESYFTTDTTTYTLYFKKYVPKKEP